MMHVGTVLSMLIGIGSMPFTAAWVARMLGAQGTVRLSLPWMGTIQNAALCWRCLFRLARGRQHEHTHLTRWD